MIITTSFGAKKMVSYITAYRIDGFVDGSISKPTQFFDNRGLNPSYINWNRLNYVFKGWMYGSVSKSISRHNSDKLVVYEQWFALEEAFSSS